MKKVLLFPLLVLGLVGFIVSCQKEPVLSPAQNVQQEETLTALDASSLVTYEKVDAEPGSVEDRTDQTCCAVSYIGFVGSQVGFLIKKPTQHRILLTIRHLGTGQTATFTESHSVFPICNNYGFYYPIDNLICKLLPEYSGNFIMTCSVQVPSDLSGTWVTCATANSAWRFIPTSCG